MFISKWFGLSSLDYMVLNSMELFFISHLYWASILFILLFSMGLVLTSMSTSYLSMIYNESVMMEIVWITFPSILLIFLGFYSIMGLYNLESFHGGIMIKVIGHQWYWTYEFSDFNISFDSYLIPYSDYMCGDFRLMEADSTLVLPLGPTSFIVSSEDVIHGFSIPSLFIRVDANPGRLNLVSLDLLVPGVYYGQCSELCGVNHSFMPIKIEVVPMTLFLEFLKMM